MWSCKDEERVIVFFICNSCCNIVPFILKCFLSWDLTLMLIFQGGGAVTYYPLSLTQYKWVNFTDVRWGKVRRSHTERLEGKHKNSISVRISSMNFSFFHLALCHVSYKKMHIMHLQHTWASEDFLWWTFSCLWNSHSTTTPMCGREWVRRLSQI